MNLLSNLDCACSNSYDDAILLVENPRCYIWASLSNYSPLNTFIFEKEQSMIKFTQLNSKVTVTN